MDAVSQCKKERAWGVPEPLDWLDPLWNTGGDGWGLGGERVSRIQAQHRSMCQSGSVTGLGQNLQTFQALEDVASFSQGSVAAMWADMYGTEICMGPVKGLAYPRG